MQQYPDIYIFIVIVVAFICGYSIVSFIIKRVKELNSRNKLNEEIVVKVEEIGHKTDEAGRGEEHFRNVLGLPMIFTPDEVKNRYNKLSDHYHPDKTAQMEPELRESARQKMQEIDEAFDYFRRKYEM